MDYKAYWYVDNIGVGKNVILPLKDKENIMGVEFSLLRVNEETRERTEGETCLVLLRGSGVLTVDGREIEMQRTSLFKENPHVVVIPGGREFTISPRSEMEFAMVWLDSEGVKDTRVFNPQDVRVERRGENELDDACFRLVKTVFDYDNLPESNLVVGEVVNLPGRWSSYPPHSHPQPEFYFYRFEPEGGYGFAQLGDEAVMVRNNSLVVIRGGLDHPQVSAPGYAMWYLWVVRHLPGNPYRGFEFNPHHRWLVEGDRKPMSYVDILR